MEFEWDEAKSDTCFTERGFDFGYVLRSFFDPERRIREDRRFDYSETRYQMLGQIEGRVFCVVYTIRQQRIRIISARKANKREVKRYASG
ncbi:BrnT family toxin [Marinospirillum sp.]|uniref:BrnT family toxin n=1 Tax=Marinospirillum sp. TaxID=2183934 RepID=UPI0028703CC0|nr:BrnT family toxin [Marinospirillum sp.]MDR9468444.1 BrnT family toxin [Marinospirillum sp.]